MYKKIRKSVAHAITNVGDPEQFEWSKWLREPQIYLEKFPKPRVDIKIIDSYQTFSAPSLFQIKNFTLTKTKVSSTVKNVKVNKKKTFKIFFLFAKPFQKQITLFDPNVARLNFILSFFYKNKELFLRTKIENKESVVSLNTKCFLKDIEKFKVKTKSENVKLKKVNCFKQDYDFVESNLPVVNVELQSTSSSNDTINIQLLPIAKDIKSSSPHFNRLEKFPKIKNIHILSVEEIKEQLQKSEPQKVLSFPINDLPERPKQYKVKLTPVDKIRVPLYNLKNVQAKEAMLKPDKLDLLQEAEVLSKNLIFDSTISTKIINPGILNQLASQERELPKEQIVQEKIIKIKPTEPKKSDQKIAAPNWDEIEKDFKALLTHQKEGMRFLLNNRNALLCDELGTKAKIQTVCALTAAIRKGIIKNALIVCTAPHIGDKKVAEKISNSEGWENQISVWGPELSFSTVKSDVDSNNSAIIEKSQIHITTYDTLLNENNNTEKSQLFSNVDCLVFDEAQNLISEKIKHEELFTFPKPKYLWLISSLTSTILEEQLSPLLKHHLPGFEQFDNILSRSKDSLKNDLPDVIREDYWLEFDKEQKQEFENTITQGRKRIHDLINSGNPFIIQSNIFTLLHQIKQIENFSTHNESSPKAELLLEHIDGILLNGQKTIIFSQYDKQGVRKIERLLKNNMIKYVLYQSGMPLKELENSVNLFKKESKINVMVAGLTAASIKVKLAEAPYFIHFDQWWNPINQWQYEDKASSLNNLSQSSNHLSVLNYFTNNSVGLNLRETLQKKGLLNKNLIECLSNEMVYSLISNEDWFEILGVEPPKSRKTAQPDFDKIYKELSVIKLDQLGQKVKALFTKLGYKNLILKPDMLNNYSSIYGTISKGMHEIKTAILCVPFNMKDAEIAKTFLNESLKINNRSVIICSKEISDSLEINNDEKISTIDFEMLAKYFSIFKVS